MPEMDGFAFARAVRREGTWRDVPLIALTSRTAPDDIARGRDAGFAAHVTKFDRSALLAALRTCLARVAARVVQ
jgi:two-component system chemotaxis sensor kinase CheA